MPKQVLRDGHPWDEFSYDQAARRIVVKGRDPRLHVFETVVREHGIELQNSEGCENRGHHCLESAEGCGFPQLIIHGVPNWSTGIPNRTAQKVSFERHLHHAHFREDLEYPIGFLGFRDVEQRWR